jgi:NAD(P)-dependent dehydrogenase (short-subunit alcohol dehydrogenase family)
MSRYYRSLFDLSNKVAVVTGGIGLLGKHFCSGLVENGASLAIIDLDGEKLTAFEEELVEKYDSQVKSYVCDISDPKSVTETIEKIVQDFGKIDVLHNNAASKSNDLGSFFAPFEKYDLKQWREVMSVNLDGMFLMAQAVGNQMKKQGTGGSIIQTSSIYGITGPDSRIYEGSEYFGQAINTPAVYSASKAGVIGLSQYLATYWAEEKIRVNTLTPGGVESGQNETFVNKYSSRVPLARMGKAYEMVGALLFLASDASSYVTGQNIIVDGGLTTW